MEDREGGDTYVVIAMATMSFLPSLCAGDVRGMMSDVERRAGASDETHHRLHDRSAFGTYRSAYGGDYWDLLKDPTDAYHKPRSRRYSP